MKNIFVLSVLIFLFSLCLYSSYQKGITECQIKQMNFANEASLISLSKTKQLITDQQNLKNKSEDLDHECQKLWNTSISACRQQLYGS